MKKARAIVLIGLVGLALAGCQAASPEQGGRGRLIGDEPMVQKAVVVGHADQGATDLGGEETV
ncbi:hypothetical protein B1A99_05265 [Cohnella sp. CIP 111063]|uniref:hypothetical protein n=1 Tax=unclassified Cohnella TaxID=2636738 RepID=UPI000B8C30A0|nr:MULTISPECIES: hypothetical protein [unclassified Cohnella]OXS60942.1 hypothetical protein B1A99_05265 [Cohnella sp. CIP 111063]PRX73476.1 hypothetical protein B0G52_10373 [Cohnella sp. SGD-V74]